jgi:hypothetical protein
LCGGEETQELILQTLQTTAEKRYGQMQTVHNKCRKMQTNLGKMQKNCGHAGMKIL